MQLADICRQPTHWRGRDMCHSIHHASALLACAASSVAFADPRYPRPKGLGGGIGEHLETPDPLAHRQNGANRVVTIAIHRLPSFPAESSAAL